MKAKAKVIAGATLMAAAMGVAAFFLTAREGEKATAAKAEVKRTAKAAKPKPKPVKAVRVKEGEKQAETKPAPKKRTKRAKKKSSGPMPDFLARHAVRSASSDNDYARLKRLQAMSGKIMDPAIRLELLEALAWFDETAVADAVTFLADPDERVSGKAGEVIAQRIGMVGDRMLRQRLFTASLKLMGDTADRDILLTQLETDKKFTCMQVVRELDKGGVRERDPELWEKLTEAYESCMGRPYVDSVKALLEYSHREEEW